jgi:hypothetical protein
MGKINVRAKGAGGEREFCRWMKDHLNLHPERKNPERNLEQVRSGGTDVIYPPFAVEVKRCEKMNFGGWWLQSVIAARKLSLEPIVAFRRNHQDWEFLIAAKLIGVDNGYMHVPQRVFVPYAKKRIEWYQENKMALGGANPEINVSVAGGFPGSTQPISRG